MPLPPAFLDELRQRADLRGLIGRTVKLAKAGRDWRGCCPFHGEKTPSFYVYADHYHCFGCGAHGDAISWLTEKQGLPFREAVAELAAAAGLDLPVEDGRAQARAERAASLRDVVDAGGRWFAERLWAAEGAAARAYLARRGVSEATARAFGLGFAPDARAALAGALAGLGADRLAEAGLTGVPEGGGPAYDRFRGRLIFPIRDARGRTAGFGGRALGDAQPKYLNSPDTPLFDKGRMLWNLDRAAPAARRAGRLLIVEGYMDAVALAGVGVDEAVAPMGTALTEHQLALAWRIVPEPTLCLDGDRAGLAAAVKAARRALAGLAPGRSLRFVTLPAGQDPDDVVRGGGAAAFEALAANAEPLHDLLWRTARDAADIGTPEGRAGLKAELETLCGGIADRDVREQYMILFRARFMDAFGWRRPGDARPVTVTPPVRVRRRRPDALAHAVLAGMLLHPRVAGDAWEALTGMALTDARLLRVRGAIADAVLADPDIGGPELVLALVRDGLRDDVMHTLFGGALSVEAHQPGCEPGAARAKLAAMAGELAGGAARATRAAAMLRESRADFAHVDAAEDTPGLRARRAALSASVKELELERRAAFGAALDLLAELGAGLGRGVRALPDEPSETHGKDASGSGNGGHETGNGRAADRSQRSIA